MNTNISKEKNLRIIITVVYLLINIFVILFLGFGWFFLLGTLQIIVFSIPQIYKPLFNFINHIRRKEIRIKNDESMENPVLSTRKIIIIIGWSCLTIIAFLKANTPIYWIIENYIRMK
jgi:hypothetical protein